MDIDVIVIGGGAAGLMTAHTAALYGKSVLVLEKNDRLGRKLLITGKGRCNITNNCDNETVIKNTPTNARFLYSALNQFDTSDTITYFENSGVMVKTERGNRVFPVSDKAYDVEKALENNCKDCGVLFKTEVVSSILQEHKKIVGVKCESGKEYNAKSVVIACGGKSYPLTGSTGDGYKLAQSMGHEIITPTPSLIPIVTEESWVKKAQGLSLKNVTLTVLDTKTNKKIYEELGEMLFTHFGVSGPLVLSASAHIRPLEQNRYKLLIDLKTGLSSKKLDNRLLRDFSENINRDFANSLGALLPRKIIPIIIHHSGIPEDIKVNQITKQMRQDLVSLIKNLPLTVKEFRPIEEAIITSGGVSVKDINPKTMQSKIVEGLFFAGEVIDVDAYTGGFNLQIAFSTAYTAGINA